MTKMQIDGVEYECFLVGEIAQAKTAREQGKQVLVARPCSKCGDLLFGLSLEPGLKAQCENGHCGSRPGVYV